MSTFGTTSGSWPVTPGHMFWAFFGDPFADFGPTSLHPFCRLFLILSGTTADRIWVPFGRDFEGLWGGILFWGRFLKVGSKGEFGLFLG